MLATLLRHTDKGEIDEHKIKTRVQKEGIAVGASLINFTLSYKV